MEMEIDDTNFKLIEELKKLSVDDSDLINKCSNISTEVVKGSLTILQVIERLGTLLVDQSPQNRSLGTWILTHILENLPVDHLDSNQLNFICTFYADRLKDNHHVIVTVFPAVFSGILTLSKFEKFPGEAVTQILRSLFENVACQQQQQDDRLKIYKIFDVFLKNHEAVLLQMGLDYVYGIISAIDGERDPKNLIFVFNWYPKFLKSVNLQHLTEEAFAIVECYFPIDFKAPPRDSNNITRESLAKGLANCLCATPKFAEFCIPMALEKLDSSLNIAKFDSLQLLEFGCTNFTEQAYIDNATQIWSQIHKELLTTLDPQLEFACYSTLSAVIVKLDHDPKATEIIKDISDTVKGNLLPDSKLFESSSKLLLNIAGASKNAFTIIAKQIIPLLTNIYNITTLPHQIKVLKILNNFIQIYTQLFDNGTTVAEIEELPMLCLQASINKDEHLSRIAFEGLIEAKQFLPQAVLTALFFNLRTLLLVAAPPELKKAQLNCFQILACCFKDDIIPKVIQEMQIPAGNETALELYIEVLCSIICYDDFRKFVIETLIDNLSKDYKTGQITIRVLRKFLENKESDTKTINSLFEFNMIQKLISWTLMYYKNFNIDCYNDVRYTIKILLGGQSNVKQELIIETEQSKILTIKLESEECYVILEDAVLSRLRKDVAIDYNILEDLTKYLSIKRDEFSESVSVQLLANLLNKCPDEVLRNYLEYFEANLTLTSELILIWVTKALVLRNHEKANDYTKKLVDLLKQRPKVALGFKIIMDDNFDALSAKSYCNRAILYRQKFFLSVCNQLVENYEPENSSYLVGLSYLLEYTPRAAILLQFPKIYRLIILCLSSCKDEEVLRILLEILLEFIKNKESCIEDHLDEFLIRILHLTNFEKMKIRILALNSIEYFALGFPLFKLLQHKNEVINYLGKSLDDRKRLARRAAVSARLEWFLLDAPI